MRKDADTTGKWNVRETNTYNGSTIDTWMNGDYKNRFSETVKTMMGSTTIPYTIGGGDYSLSQITRSIFALSLAEIGGSDSQANVEGSAVPIASTLQSVNQIGDYISQWTRTPEIDNTGHFNKRAFSVAVSSITPFFDELCRYICIYRPAFTLPGGAFVDVNLNLIEE